METNLAIIMAYQLDSFNNDHFINNEFLRLKELFNIKTAIETGTAYGSTTMWLSENFDKTITIESNKKYLDVAIERWTNKGLSEKINAFLGDSATVLSDVISRCNVGDDTIYFGDAHWYSSCPLLDELKAIAEHGIKPCIVIHDMKNPDDNRFGFDKYNDQEFTFEWVKPSLDLIYGEAGYLHYFNTGFKKESAQRGVLFCTPK